MFLHIGNGKNIRTSSILGIFDADTATLSADTQRFLRDAEQRGDLLLAKEEVPKSFVVYFEEQGGRAGIASAGERSRCAVSRTEDGSSGTKCPGGKLPSPRVCFSQISSAALLSRTAVFGEQEEE